MLGRELWVDYEEEPGGSEHVQRLQDEAIVEVHNNEGL